MRGTDPQIRPRRPRRYCGRACQARAYRARKDGGPRPVRRIAPDHRAKPDHVPDRATVVRVAVRLADAEGLAAVSIRALAAHLGLPAMSLYRRVSGKDDLVAGMADTVLAEYRPPPEPATGWRARLEHEARQEWALYQRHPWILPVLATTRPPLGPGVLAAVDRTLAALGDRVDPEAAFALYLLVSGYVQGMALLSAAESAAVRDTGVTGGRWWSARSAALPRTAAARHPALAALVERGLVAPPAPDAVRAWFEFGLRRVLDGVAVFLAEPVPPAGHRSTG
ncbi:regulatory protein, tetR family [Amycolatopsis arida]|uniref:Regulatory protein, tetR family n=1 Tax=Amycolatopsis arida TaxID=587909 RepID=A0A1I5KVH7_9PSEU|nr:TetR/AcrR family transcriptional regulator [Amycolatopsis arida]TDX85852.1 regulatory TetR family protein [Amycolatopsis arida]SFO88963.1 regulatory protein, tetR family [Amycolatopsis arida]